MERRIIELAYTLAQLESAVTSVLTNEAAKEEAKATGISILHLMDLQLACQLVTRDFFTPTPTKQKAPRLF